MENPWPGKTAVVKRNGKIWRTFSGRVFEFNTNKDDIFELKYGGN